MSELSTTRPNAGGDISPKGSAFGTQPLTSDDTPECGVRMTDLSTLGDLFAKYGCDKGSKPAEPWMWGQGYERVYEPLLDPIRHDPITLLELGWGEWDPERKDHANPLNGGRSARAWREYFTNPYALIAVVDIEPKVNTAKADGLDVALFQGSQDDPEFLRDVYLQTGAYDVIIDDASHVSSKTIASFQILWQYLKPGGLYVVEDLHSSFHDWYFGHPEASQDPGDFRTNTAFNYFRRLSAEPFFKGERAKGPKVKLAYGTKSRTEWDVYNCTYWLGYQIESITFHAPQIIVMRKRLEKDYASVHDHRV